MTELPGMWEEADFLGGASDDPDDYRGCANFDRYGACGCSSGITGLCRVHERSGCCKGHASPGVMCGECGQTLTRKRSGPGGGDMWEPHECLHDNLTLCIHFLRDVLAIVGNAQVLASKSWRDQEPIKERRDTLLRLCAEISEAAEYLPALVSQDDDR